MYALYQCCSYYSVLTIVGNGKSPKSGCGHIIIFINHVPFHIPLHIPLLYPTKKRKNSLKQDSNWCMHLAWLGRPRTYPTSPCLKWSTWNMHVSFMFQHISCGCNQWFSCMNFPVIWQYWRVYYSMHDSWNMHVTGRDLGCLTGRYHACYMHELLPHISCTFQAIFHAWYWRIPCLIQMYSMHGTGVFHTWYRHIPCMVQAYSMRGIGMCVPCVVQVFPCMRTMYSTGSCTI